MNEELPETPPPERPRTRRNRNAWWAEQWTDSLLDNAAPEKRQRGRLLARTGSVFGFRAEPGKLRADVRPARGELHEVAVDVPRFGLAEQTTVLDCAAARARFLAELLHGTMDAEFHAFLLAAGISLLPDPATVGLRCTCTDALPCAHIAALLATFEERLGRNPFLLFRVRGVLRETLLEGCQIRRQASSALAQADLDARSDADPLVPTADVSARTPSAEDWWGSEDRIAAVAIPSSTAVVQTVLSELGFPARIDEESDAARLLEDAYTVTMDMEVDGQER